ncbi:co-chaperone GroES [Natranaerobius thermophilus]|uniref:Co-chaperonin GroES n=1 Tax=Natranaerobius thermophilus (strain ATCC BAA-1301 / DSM 18059 / JW/NM-WN-LF) TaxID=457570 RepID=CH10_NATTJ|nr:co-chaperone GroES [Natranaerobius thermophilus]B2A5V2.1 RecName: Full=Co-chaperonin GroES; AltName: Full=10 kDa chaperonin; AltName: Full=Chaperonin-10; Short=Cpn10 [Natranaerobius thermophilus JW/NM-WN-LF]ACB84045.1 chaperonin Cpn10 [Natranaerobius thermophilus JW/NM-WN-LF]
MNLKPLGDRIVIKILEAEEKTESGIVLPEKAKEKPQEGEVVAVGSGKTLDDGSKVEPEVKAGDKVVYSKFAGNEVEVDGEEYLIMRQDDILAVIE